MNLELTAEQESFRRGVCQLLCEESVRAEVARPAGCRPTRNPACWRSTAGWASAAGWRRTGHRSTAASAATSCEKAILTEELILHGVPDIVHTLSVDIVGLAVHQLGTPEQQARWLPRLAPARARLRAVQRAGCRSDLGAWPPGPNRTATAGGCTAARSTA